MDPRPMRMEIPSEQLKQLVGRQLANLFDLAETERPALDRAVDTALARCHHCFARLANKYYRRDGEVYFNPFHSGQYGIFLYFLANTLFQQGTQAPANLADRVYYLNKALNGFDLYYEVNMPAVFSMDHAVGSVIGRGTFGDHFFFSQNCTVGNNHGLYPVLGRNVQMLSGAKIIGQAVVGDNVIIAADAFVKDEVIPDCAIVFGRSPELSIVRKDAGYFPTR